MKEDDKDFWYRMLQNNVKEVNRYANTNWEVQKWFNCGEHEIEIYDKSNDNTIFNKSNSDFFVVVNMMLAFCSGCLAVTKYKGF